MKKGLKIGHIPKKDKMKEVKEVLKDTKTKKKPMKDDGMCYGKKK